MEEKAYRLGVLVGRFQTLHAGHEEMIQKALVLCERVCIFVGSAQEAGTEKNPFSFDLREQMLRSVFGEKLLIYPLPDIGVGNNALWGEYVLEQAVQRLGQMPDLLITAKESRRVSWFDGVKGLNVTELYVPKNVPISATQMRQYLLEGNEAAWQQESNPKLWHLYPTMREQVLHAQGNLRTDSI